MGILIVLIFCFVYLLQITGDDSIGDGGIRMEIDVSGLTPHNGVWDPDMYMKLSSPQHAVILCNVKIVGMNDHKIPCDIPKRHIRKGHNEYHVTIYSKMSGKIYAHMDASFDTNDDNQVTGMPEHRGLLNEQFRASLSPIFLGILAISAGTLGANYYPKVFEFFDFIGLKSKTSRQNVPTTDNVSEIDDLITSTPTGLKNQSKAVLKTPTEIRHPSSKSSIFTKVSGSVIGLGLVAGGLFLNDPNKKSLLFVSGLFNEQNQHSVEPHPYDRKDTSIGRNPQQIPTATICTSSSDRWPDDGMDTSGRSSTLRVITRSLWRVITRDNKNRDVGSKDS